MYHMYRIALQLSNRKTLHFAKTILGIALYRYSRLADPSYTGRPVCYAYATKKKNSHSCEEVPAGAARVSGSGVGGLADARLGRVGEAVYGAMGVSCFRFGVCLQCPRW